MPKADFTIFLQLSIFINTARVEAALNFSSTALVTNTVRVKEVECGIS